MGQSIPRTIAVSDPGKYTVYIFATLLSSGPTPILTAFILFLDFKLGFDRVTVFGWAFRTFLMFTSIGSILAIYAAVRGPFREKGLAVDDEFLHAMGANGPICSVRLTNIAEVFIRNDGTFRHLYRDRGMGLNLHTPEFIMPGGITDKKRPALFQTKFKCHFLTTPTYHQPIEEVALVLADAVSKAQGGEPMPVTTHTHSGEPIVLARPPTLASTFARPASGPAPEDLAPPGTECIQCGYDLRFAPRESRCPECGTEVRASLGGRTLNVANRTWVRLLALGSVAMTIASVCGFPLLFMMRVALDAAGTAAPLPDHIVIVTLICLAIAIPCLLLGTWLLTRPEPIVRVAGDEPRSRIVARGLMLVPIALIAVGLSRSGPMIFSFLLALVSLVLMTGMVLFYARQLCKRLNRPGGTIIATLAAVMFFTETVFLGGITSLGFAMTYGGVQVPSPPTVMYGPSSLPTTSQGLTSGSTNDSDVDDFTEEDQEEDVGADGTALPMASSQPHQIPVTAQPPSRAPQRDRGGTLMFVSMFPMPIVSTTAFGLLTFWLFQAARAPRQ